MEVAVLGIDVHLMLNSPPMPATVAAVGGKAVHPLRSSLKYFSYWGGVDLEVDKWGGDQSPSFEGSVANLVCRADTLEPIPGQRREYYVWKQKRSLSRYPRFKG
ncbi:hypothetical protein PhaeoP18_03962 (plasmid) [Phaeobacter piscinae]|nr:hypothetical protein PhaeoP14_03723 [Phaeobacter piscinae]AUR38178.1 hypothetical protein PhaeoP18_03962 [Phaeobacter piscinae]